MKIPKSGVRALLFALVVTSGIAVVLTPALAATSAATATDGRPEATSGTPARPPDYGPGHGRGMMGGWGDGYGRRMMDRQGGRYGHGMMTAPLDGYGMGPGMMRGWGFAAAGLALSDEQQEKIDKIHADVADTQWNLAGKIFAAAGKLHELIADEAPDRSAVEAAYKALSDLRLQQIELRLDTRAKVDAVLTKPQREQLRTWRGEAGGAWR